MASQTTTAFRITSALGSGLAWLILVAPIAIAQPMKPAEDPAADAIGESVLEESQQAPLQPMTIEAGLPARRLSLDDALALAVQQNLGVEVARYEPLIAEQDMKGAWGAYDPNFSADVGYQLVESPNTFVLNTVRTNQQRIVDGGASLRSLLPYVGASVGVEWDTTRTRTNSTLEALVPRYDSAVFLTANVPLLRGLIWNEPWTQVKISKIGYSASVDTFRQTVMDISESTINAYWSLVADREQLAVAQKSLETALALLDQTKTQYEVGVVSKVEVVEAEAGVADREFNLITARNRFENAEDVLIDAVLGRELKAYMPFRIVPADDPENYEIREVDLEESIGIAFRNLPELQVADRTIEQREVELKFAKNARLPRFDIDARYGFVNISGEGNPGSCGFFSDTLQPGDPPGSPTPRDNCIASLGDSGYSQSYDALFSDDGFENATVTGTFSIPIPNTTARRNVTKSEIELRRARSRRARTEQGVILTVRAAARGLLASAQGIEAAERRRLAAQEQLRAERIRLEHGESTPFEVLQRESDLVDAESQKIRALQAYRAADARLDRAQGTILETHRIQIDDVRQASMR